MKSRNAAGAAGWIWILGFLIPFALYAPVRAQNIEGQIIAAQYGDYQVTGTQDETSTTGFAFPLGTCQVSGGGRNFSGFATGVPLKIVDANPALVEVATPSAVNIDACTVTVSTVHSHQLPYFLTSGTGGLQEAINANGTGQGANTVVLNAAWYELVPPTSSATVIASVHGNTSLGLVDVTTTPYTTYSWNGSQYVANSSGGGLLSQKVVYTSKLTSIPASTAVVPGSSASGTTDAASILNTAISGGNVDLEVDGGYALSTSLVLSSNTTIHCIAPQYGFIMQTTSNASVLVNAHQNSPTTSSGTGGYLPSNITDTSIKVQGCQLNANSTQAVTGTNSQSTAHGATPGGLFVYGGFFLGVNGLTIDGNEIYDTGAWGIFTSNTLYERITNNYIHQPTPTVAAKFTDGIHTIGPKQFFWTQNNRINAGDDSIANNADDGNRTGSGDSNASYVQTAVKWGPILDGHIDNNTFDTTYYGIRFYSATELIDRISVTNTSGTACGNTGIIDALSALGNGNIGKITFAGWAVQTSGTCNTFSVPYNFQVTANYQNLELDGVSITNPGATWPIWTETSTTPGIRSFRNWELDTQSSGFSNLIVLNGGAGGQIALSGINWWDAAGTGSVVSGSAAPNTLTCSNYNGPNRLLAAGFVPTNENGDCFTNTYTATTTYVNTTFNEASSGTALAGSTPATCTNGCSGTWTAASGGPSSGAWRYTTNSATLSGSCTSGGSDNFCPVYINIGTDNYTLRVNVSQFDTGNPAGLAFVVRWTNNSNFVTFLQSSSGTWGLYDVVGGTTTSIASGSLGTSTGTWTVVMNGTSAKLINPSGTSLTGTISSSNTSNNVGLSNNLTSFLGSDIITAFSVKSN